MAFQRVCTFIFRLFVVNPRFLTQVGCTWQYVQASTPAGDTALHLAARRRDVDMARILVDYGAAVDAVNGAGQTSLHIAAAEGDEPLVKYFYGVRANAAIADNEGA